MLNLNAFVKISPIGGYLNYRYSSCWDQMGFQGDLVTCGLFFYADVLFNLMWQKRKYGSTSTGLRNSNGLRLTVR